ncbi:MAG: hypothetical protein RIS41_785 [Actinomycetota bacterium]|jgi:hypothetical protein
MLVVVDTHRASRSDRYPDAVNTGRDHDDEHVAPAVPGELDEAPTELQMPADLHMMETARRRYGAVGAFVAGGMLGLDRILGRKAKEEAPVVWEAAGEPEDIDRGMTIEIDDETSVVSAPNRARRRNVRKRRNNGTEAD